MQLTYHSATRMAQRGFHPEELDFVARHGQARYRTGVKFVFLGRRDIPESLRRSHGHLEGLTLVMCPRTDTVITCYRNREAIGDIRRKHKRSAKPRQAGRHLRAA